MLPPITPQTALFLDFDGTLVGIASEPELVEIPPALGTTLAALSRNLNGALALVSGRGLMDLDSFLAPLTLPAAGEHGARRRSASGALMTAPAADLRQVILAAEALVQTHPGLRLELKELAISVHYRHAPELEALCLEVMRNVVSHNPGLDLMQGKCVIDIKPAGVSKGTAIRAFMAEAPFAGRVPVFAGDDVTDEAGFAEVQRLGGLAVKVGEGPTIASYRCTSVADFADWLAAGAASLEPTTTRLHA